MTENNLLSGLGIAQQSKRLNAAIDGAIDATKRYPQFRAQRFLEALHAAGFDVTEIQRVSEIQQFEEKLFRRGDSTLSD